MPRKSFHKNRTKARKAKQKLVAPKRHRVISIAHHHPSGAGLALLAASMMRIKIRKEN